jgi:hypothetical protein
MTNFARRAALPFFLLAVHVLYAVLLDIYSDDIFAYQLSALARAFLYWAIPVAVTLLVAWWATGLSSTSWSYAILLSLVIFLGPLIAAIGLFVHSCHQYKVCFS